jgi:hypothetical protein
MPLARRQNSKGEKQTKVTTAARTEGEGDVDRLVQVVVWHFSCDTDRCKTRVESEEWMHTHGVTFP